MSTSFPPGQRRTGYLYLSLAMITVGSTVIASKMMAQGLPPFTATALRFALALPLFLAIRHLMRTELPRTSMRDWILLIIQAGAGSVGYTTLLISGMALTSAADAGVIIGTLPVVAALIAVVLLGERPDRRLILATGLATAGVVAVGWQGAVGTTGSLLGNLMIVGAVVCEGLFILLNKRLRVPIDPLTLSTRMAGLGFVIAVVPALVVEQPWTLAIDRQALIATAYYAAIPTVCGFLLWYAGSARVSGLEASLFTAVAPISAVLMAGLLLGETITIAHVVGMACVLAAVVGVALRPERPGGG